MLKEFPFYNDGTMTNEQKEALVYWRAFAELKLAEIRALELKACAMMCEFDMTADFIWGNCSLAELEAALTAQPTQTKG